MSLSLEDGIFVMDDGTDCDGRARCRWWIGRRGVVLGGDDDLRGGVGAPFDARKMMKSLLSFLLACAEARGEESENWDIFSKLVRDWAAEMSCKLEEAELLLEEEPGEAQSPPSSDGED